MFDAYIQSVISRSLYYKKLADESFAQLTDEQLFLKPNEASNSIWQIVKHMSGNMKSRWTDFLVTDGEKTWRQRDREFENDEADRKTVLAVWEEGWLVFLDTLRSLEIDDLGKTVTIRSEPLLVIDAINRQLAHYPYHVGQIVYLARLFKNQLWKNLSIPPGESEAFNARMRENKKG